MNSSTMSPNDLSIDLPGARAEHEAGQAILFDIRERQEYATGVVQGARLLPMSELGARLAEIPNDPAQPVLLMCRTHNRSANVAHALRERGWNNVRFVVGGMSMWAMQGWPMVAPADA